MRPPRNKKPSVDLQTGGSRGQHVDGPGFETGLQVAQVGLGDAHAPGQLGLADAAVLAEGADPVADKGAGVVGVLGVHGPNISGSYPAVKGSAICQIIGRRVVEVRRERRITQAQLAGLMGVTQPHLSNLEKGQRGWTVEQLVNAASTLDVDPCDLMTETAKLNHEEAAVVSALRAGDPVQVMTAVAAAMGHMRR